MNDTAILYLGYYKNTHNCTICKIGTTTRSATIRARELTAQHGKDFRITATVRLHATTSTKQSMAVMLESITRYIIDSEYIDYCKRIAFDHYMIDRNIGVSNQSTAIEFNTIILHRIYEILRTYNIAFDTVYYI